MVEVYIAIKEDKIVFSCESSSRENVLKALDYMKITDFDNIQTIPTTNNPRRDTYLDEYNEDWSLKTDYDRVQLGRLKLQDDQELDHANKCIRSKKHSEPPKETDGMSIKEIKAWAKKVLSGQCVSKNYYEILPNHKRENILVGATEGYPDYLCGERGVQSIKIINQIFQEIYATYSKQIDLAGSLEEIQGILDSIQFPTAKNIENQFKMS